MITIESPTLVLLKKAAIDFLKELNGRKIVVFDGEMGAGKTTFIQAVLREMGIDNPDGSPTYSIINEYNSANFGKIYHLDVYRLERIEEAISIGIEDVLDGDHFCFIEWGEKIKRLLPEETVWVKIEVIENQKRKIVIR